MGKRTPRFPVSYSHRKDYSENYISPVKRGWKSENENDDEVAHVAALALAEASQRGGSPQVSRMPYRRTGPIKSSPVQSWERMVFSFSLCSATTFVAFPVSEMKRIYLIFFLFIGLASTTRDSSSQASW